MLRRSKGVGAKLSGLGGRIAGQFVQLLLEFLGTRSEVASFVRAALAAVPLAILLTWLLLSSLGPDIAKEMEIQRALGDIAIGEVEIHRDALSARAGLAQDGEALARDVGMMRGSAARLAALVEGDIPDVIDRIRDVCRQQEALAVRFMAGNARLQISLAYFDRLNAQLRAEPDAMLSTRTRALIDAVMQLIYDARAENARDVQDRLNALEAEANRAVGPGEISNILQYGRMLLEFLPRVDFTLRGLLVLSSTAEREAVRTHFQHLRANQQARAERYRILLYLVSLSLLAVLLRLGWLLRVGTLALRERAEAERLIAQVSTSFIACQPEGTGDRILEALAVMGHAGGAERAYVIRLGNPPTIQLWSRPDLAAPRRWPESLNDVMGEILAVPDDVLAVPHDNERIPDALHRLLDAAGITRWAAVKLLHEDQVVGLLCFDEPGQRRASFEGATSLLRTAGIVVSNALQRERIFHERISLENRLQQAQRLQTVGTLASGVAHNFNNIIGVMLGHAEMALDDLPRKSAASAHVHQVMRAGERARELIARILDFGRGRNANRGDVSVDALVAETVAMVETSLQDIQISTTGDAEGACVAGEAAELQQVLVNLIRNAAQASEAGARVLVAISRHRVRQRRILSHGVIPPGDYVSIRVSDHGSGIEASALANIFQPFFTTRPAGTGLGLATAQEVVRESGGAFEVRSAPGQGSTFEIWLPSVLPGRTALSVSASGNGESVMVVGTDQASVVRDEETLAALGYEPTGFHEADAALAAMRTAPDRFDIVVVDEFLPSGRGLELAAKLRRFAPRCAIVLSSSQPDKIRTETLSMLGIREVVARPWRAGTVATALSRALARH